MTYDGGKNGAGVYQSIINQIPPHRYYYELFSGSGAILRLKKPSMANIAIDKDPRSMKMLVSATKGMPAFHAIVGDAISFLKTKQFHKEDFVYCDPPYLFDTRSCKTPMYRYELEEKDHIELLTTIKLLNCYVAISGYDSKLYNDYLHSWRKIFIPTVKRNGKRAIEVVWMNYPQPTHLHDYSYLGKNFRERERIKRKIHRWTKRLESLPELERNAILDSLRSINATTCDTAGDIDTADDTVHKTNAV